MHPINGVSVIFSPMEYSSGLQDRLPGKDWLKSAMQFYDNVNGFSRRQNKPRELPDEGMNRARGQKEQVQSLCQWENEPPSAETPGGKLCLV
ncbi:hypothetical protein [uncultured Desulfobacter sp.]|uniref:hypothetical protein n=1 Tax=uncultured Desulfobacter sp. TaxID=240139 RepID=UPI00374864EF